ncbi:hypothetical protein HDU97_007280 [Phlyctochytrium planicorne]|nr:hypothetical protein HDU97_007280 [Phlyctochytrium planicorne]
MGDRSGVSLQEIPKVEHMENLFNSLKSLESRRVYVFFGHSIFTSCTWAGDPHDYLYCAAPTILSSYVAMACIVGIATLSEAKQGWRLYGSIALIAGVVVEGFMLDSNLDMIGRPEGLYKYVETTRWMRQAAFALACLIFAAFDARNVKDSDKLNAILDAQKGVYNRLFGTRLARASIFGDGQLRTKYSQYHKEEEAHIEAITRTTEYDTLRKQNLRKINVSQMIQDVANMSGSIMATAKNEGIIQGVELPAQSFFYFNENDDELKKSE